MAVLLRLLICSSAAAASTKPSFVIMLADDMVSPIFSPCLNSFCPHPVPIVLIPVAFVLMKGWGDWSRTGSPARTPHLDAMSRSQHAVWFHRAYSGNPIW